jgi:hypothetical protein
MDLLLRLFPNPLLLIVLFCLLQLLLIYPAVSLSDSLEAVFPQQEGDSTPKQRDCMIFFNIFIFHKHHHIFSLPRNRKWEDGD